MTQKSIIQVSTDKRESDCFAGSSAVKFSTLLMVLATVLASPSEAVSQDSARTKSNLFAGPGKGHFFGGKRASNKQENGFEAKCSGSCSGSCK